MAKDQKTISDEPHEIAAAAKSMKCLPIVIHMAKHITESNNRKVIAEFIKKHKGSSVAVIF